MPNSGGVMWHFRFILLLNNGGQIKMTEGYSKM